MLGSKWRYAPLSATAGALLVTFIVCSTLLVDKLAPNVDSAVRSLSTLSPGNLAWQSFLDTRDPYGMADLVSMKIFNLTNAEDVLNNGTTVDLQQLEEIHTQRHRTVKVVSSSDGVVEFYPTFWYGGLHGDDSASHVTSLYVPMIVLFAHGFGGDGEDLHVSGVIAHNTRAGRLLSGQCDSPDLGITPGCTVSASETAAVSNLRAKLSQARWLLAHTLELLPASTWRPLVDASGSGVGAARNEGVAGQLHNGLDIDVLSSGTLEADIALLAAFPQLSRVHPLSVVMTASARKAYATRPGLAKNWAGMLFVHKPAYQIIFGYKDPFYEALNMLNDAFPAAYPGLLGNSSAGDWDENLPIHRAAQAAGRWSMRTGEEDPYSPNAYDALTWLGNSSVYCCSAGPCRPQDHGVDPVFGQAWLGKDANSVQGSLGDTFNAGVQPGQELMLWLPRLARAIPLHSTDEHPTEPNYYDPTSIPVLTFRSKPQTFATADPVVPGSIPANANYHAYGPTGVLNSTTCAPAKLPLFHSLPYFLYGNASALNKVAGLPTAEPGQHDMLFKVEPVTGRVIEKQDRWQINVWLADQDGAPLPPMAAEHGGVAGQQQQQRLGGLWPELRPLYLPLLWIDAHSSVGPAMKDAIIKQVVAPSKLANMLRTASYVGIGVSAAVLLVSLAANVRSSAVASHEAKSRTAGAAMAAVSLSQALDVQLNRLGRQWGMGPKHVASMGGAWPAMSVVDTDGASVSGSSTSDSGSMASSASRLAAAKRGYNFRPSTVLGSGHGKDHGPHDSATEPLLPSFDSADGSASEVFQRASSAEDAAAGLVDGQAGVDAVDGSLRPRQAGSPRPAAMSATATLIDMMTQDLKSMGLALQ